MKNFDKREITENSKITVAVGGMDGGASPMLPYIGVHAETAEFTGLAKNCLAAALLRCGFDVVVVKNSITDPQDIVTPVNRLACDAAVGISYAAFGSRRRFNRVCGPTLHYSVGRATAASRRLGEDICAAVDALKHCDIAADGIYGAANCPIVTVDCGYCTEFEEAKLLFDPDHAVAMAEHIALGVCENFDMPYIRRDKLDEYPVFCSNGVGKRGNKVKLVQAALCVNGYDLALDGVFGKATELAVRTFCINNDIDNGVTHEFWKAALGIERKPVALGGKSVLARYIQRKLRAKLYDAPLTDVLDERTLGALREFLTETTGACDTIADNTVGTDIIELLVQNKGARPRLF